MASLVTVNGVSTYYAGDTSAYTDKLAAEYNLGYEEGYEPGGAYYEHEQDYYLGLFDDPGIVIEPEGEFYDPGISVNPGFAIPGFPEFDMDEYHDYEEGLSDDDEKPFVDWFLPGDQDSPDDAIPFLEDGEIDVIPGDSGFGDLGLSALLPLMIISQIFDD